MNYYNEIKEQLINNEVYKKVKDYSKNRSDLETYYNVGKLLVEAQGVEGETYTVQSGDSLWSIAKKLNVSVEELKAANDLTSNLLKIGQIKKYMGYIDKHIKAISHDKTIGIIISKRDNHFVMEYCSDERIFNTVYKLI